VTSAALDSLRMIVRRVEWVDWPCDQDAG
jgi:hypothetical protein